MFLDFEIITILTPILIGLLSNLVIFFDYSKKDVFTKFYFSSPLQSFVAFLVTIIIKILLSLLMGLLFLFYVLNKYNITFADIERLYNHPFSNQAFNFSYAVFLIALVSLFLVSILSGVTSDLKSYTYKVPQSEFNINSNELNLKFVPKNTILYFIETINKEQDWLCFYKNERNEIIRIIIPASKTKEINIAANKKPSLNDINKNLQKTPKKNLFDIFSIYLIMGLILLLLSIWIKDLKFFIISIITYLLTLTFIFRETIWQYIKSKLKKK